MLNQNGNCVANPLNIQAMTRSEMDFALDLAATEGWNPGLGDADAFYATDPNGFLIGRIDDRPVGCISAVKYSSSFGFIGFYIVMPELRGQEYGIQLWNAAMKRLDGCNTGLDGVMEQQDNYRKSGFNFAYSNIRFEFTNTGSLDTDDTSTMPLSQVPTSDLLVFDARHFPAIRRSFLNAWTNMPSAHGVAYCQAGQIQGYGVIRPCRQGWKIGPLFADRADIADKLFGHLCDRIPAGTNVYLDVPEPNTEGLNLADRYKMRRVFGTARMYTGKFPSFPLDHVFGVTSFELG